MKILFYRESFVQSVLSDIFTFGLLILCMYLSVHVNLFWQIVIAIMFVMFMAIKAASKAICREFTDKESLLTYIHEELE